MTKMPEPVEYLRNEQPVFKQGTPLLQIIRNGVSRDFENGQIILEASLSGFVIDDSVVNYIRDVFHYNMDKDLLDN